MRMMVAGFAGFLSLWSLAALADKDAAWQDLEVRLVRIHREIVEARDADWLRLLRSERERIERMLETRPEVE